MAEKDTTSLGFGYYESGQRMWKTVGNEVRYYVYRSSRLAAEITGDYALYFHHDANGGIVGFTHVSGNTQTEYFYRKNLQGDVIGIVDSTGASVAEYRYDAWGRILEATGTMASVNPIRYRGYYYDAETGLYYLHSRYYDPEVGRFINPDAFASTGQGILGANMFAYCGNEPILHSDPDGNSFIDPLVEQIVRSVYSLLLDIYRKVLAASPDLDINSADPRSYNCLGNAVNKQTLLKLFGYKQGYSSRETFEALQNVLGEENVRELRSPYDELRPGEYLVALKCGQTDYHFARYIGNGYWSYKCGKQPNYPILQKLIMKDTWYVIYDVNGVATIGDPNLGFPVYDDETIFFAISEEWNT